MKHSQIAEYFGVSLTTVANWKRQGAPISGDLPSLAEWHARRGLERDDLHLLLPGLPALVGELTRRRLALDKAIAWVNAMPEDATCDPGVIKAALCLGLSMERELLDVPRLVLTEAKPETLPHDICRITLAALDRTKKENPDEEYPASPRSSDRSDGRASAGRGSASSRDLSGMFAEEQSWKRCPPGRVLQT